MKCSDIPIQEVLQACADYQAEIATKRPHAPFGLSVADAVNIVEEMQCEAPLIALQNKYPFKVVLRKMEKLVDRGLIEYGVNITYAWPTPEGHELLNSLAVR